TTLFRSRIEIDTRTGEYRRRV
ncbi:MAG: hypothetical protein RJA69_371, partial [Pseudomonadota bacterium]